MSAEDRADPLREALSKLRLYGSQFWDEEWGTPAKVASEGLNASEGLALVAREDQLTPREMGLVYMDVDEFDDYFGGQYGIELQDLERKLRRLASVSPG